jgi:hypothetical protein
MKWVKTIRRTLRNVRVLLPDSNLIADKEGFKAGEGLDGEKIIKIVKKTGVSENESERERNKERERAREEELVLQTCLVNICRFEE